MKLRLFILSAMALCLLPASAQKKYETGNPSDSNYDYLKDYRPLKEYINYDKYPNFKLGVGTTVNDYLNSRSLVGGLTNDNFTETVAGNAMKMSSCVNSNGDMNFTTVKNYVKAATEAGLNIYGHTLAWHSQQPNAWLRSLIKDKPAPKDESATESVWVPVVAKDFTTKAGQSIGWSSSQTDYGYTVTYSSADGMKVHTTKKCTNSWDVQFLAVTDLTLDAGADYRVTMRVKGSAAGNFHTKLGDWSDGVTAELPFTTEWKDVVVDYKDAKGGNFYMLQCGDFVGDIYVKSITIEKEERARTITEERRCIVVKATKKESEAWDNQFWVVTGDFAEGASYVFTADIRADQAASASTQIHTDPGTYVWYEAIGNISFTTEWKTITVSGKLSRAGSSIAFNLNELAAANNYYFDNLSFKVNGVEMLKNGDLEGTDVSSFYAKVDRGGAEKATITEKITYTYTPSPIPLTQDEKIEILSGAMEKWIKGMMEACDGKVKAWDVVNEAISGGGNDGEGNYNLQHANEYVPGGTTWDVGGENFYWQDHMGDLAYVRTAIRLARKYGPEDIKLFINDYNLESDWDDNKKVKSLINWIKKWEADGETYVDGIGTQMHISCYMNEGTQKSKKDHIKKMFELMAATGKYVRVSEFDMGMVDASGKDVPTGSMTEEMHQRMADYYEWIVKTYLEVVPPAQQWGICFWCPTDSPANSGWRANTPVGLWTLDFYRKHAYAGVVKGLGGEVYSGIDAVTADDELSSDAPVYDLRGNRMQSDLKDLPSGFYIIGGRKIMK